MTHDITVEVEPYYLTDQSDPEENRYIWGYRVVISNGSVTGIRILNRYWNITDQDGNIEEVRGAGVVGEQPRLAPGDSYQYDSLCPLSTPSGLMFGSYEVETDKGEFWDVAIPAFSLDLPGLRKILH